MIIHVTEDLYIERGTKYELIRHCLCNTGNTALVKAQAGQYRAI